MHGYVHSCYCYTNVVYDCEAVLQMGVNGVFRGLPIGKGLKLTERCEMRFERINHFYTQ